MSSIRFFLIALVLGTILYSANLDAQVCTLPTEFYAVYDGTFGEMHFTWWYQEDCPLLYFELEYSSAPFDPGTGEAQNSVTTIETYYSTFWQYEYAWVRAICDCDGDGEPDMGSGGSGDGWVMATYIFNPPPPPPIEGLTCSEATTVPVRPYLNCPGYSSDLMFGNWAQDVGFEEISCADDLVYTLWRRFIPPCDGQVSINMNFNSFGGSFGIDYGLVLLDECNGEELTCIPNIHPDTISTILTALDPGNYYSLGIWLEEYPFDTWGDPLQSIYGQLGICEVEPICQTISSVSASVQTDTEVNLNWGNGSQTEWTLEYGPSPLTAGEGTLIEEITESEYTLNGLLPETSYEVIVRPVCDTGQLECGDHQVFSFITFPTMNITSTPEDGSFFCCDEYEIPEGMSATSFCGEVSYFYEDEYSNEGCPQTLYRSYFAQDSCGNSISHLGTFEFMDNGFGCSCDSEQHIDSLGGGREGLDVAIYGEWAVAEGGDLDRIYRYENNEWVLHTAMHLGYGSNKHGNLALYEDVLVSKNKVYRFDGVEWNYETTLISSSEDSGAYKSAIYENTIALIQAGRLYIYEHDGITWSETHSIDNAGWSLDMDSERIAMGIYGTEVGDTIGVVYKKVADDWLVEGELSYYETAATPGFSIALDGDNVAIGHRWSANLHTYRFDGESWNLQQVIEENPYDVQYGYEHFGHDVDIEGNIMLVGDYGNNFQGSWSGDIVVYKWNCEEWQVHGHIVPVNGGGNQRFGAQVALSGSSLIVGIDDTYWLGGGGYFGDGDIWIYDCIDISPVEMEITGSSGGSLSCSDSLPDSDYVIHGGDCSEITVDITLDTLIQDCVLSIFRTIAASDGLGNEVSLEQVYELIDDLPPLASQIPDDITAECGTIPTLEEPIFTDACSEAVDVTFDEEELVGSGCISEFIVRSWTAVDDCGNQTEVEQVIEFIDEEGPEISCPPDTLITVTSSDSLFVLPDFFDWMSQAPSDNCTDVPARESYIFPDQGDSIGQGIYVVTLVAIDDCSNASECNFTITVEMITGLEEMEESSISIYPNPVSDELYVDVSSRSIGNSTLIIHDIVGNQVMGISVSSETTIIDCRTMAQGLYTISLIDDMGQVLKVRRIVIE